MNTSTFSHVGADRTQSSAAQVVREFVVAWFQATPVYLVYRALTTR
jgi:hypothetical protein